MQLCQVVLIWLPREGTRASGYRVHGAGGRLAGDVRDSFVYSAPSGLLAERAALTDDTDDE